MILTAGSGLVASASTSTSTSTERVARLEADEAHRTLTAGYVTQAKLGLARARRLRAGGDEADAVVADRAAQTWLDAAETLARSVDWETEASSLQLGALDAGARAERERALLEEALGNAGRRRAELARIERERSPAAPRTRTADIDGGVSAPARTSAREGDAGGGRRAGDGGGALELHMPGAPGTKRPGGAAGEESPP